MVFVTTVCAAGLALALHVLRVPGFTTLVAVPLTALVVMCAMGVTGRVVRPIRSQLIAMVPPSIPRPEIVVWLSAACELAAAIGLLIGPLRLASAVALALFLLSIFPANVRAAHLAGDADGTFVRRIVVRGAKQTIFIGLCVWVVVVGA
ncbi:putative membrane protein [Microbacterium sp. SORGH_AS428]|uniref:hypothetical protein n=1 Tax=Microbacterium sp. SORGH_AS_0428 TaxID=3041788 RepID=UPI002859196F|nr:hypothetical protein [Microbacterium sp. SORGH_AS_0428]MDR6199951.1 putative membrane protein [Microbacterium sp. SORGH_AS_0428]